MLEVIAISVADVINISKTQATNIELCGSINEDGLSPNLKLVNAALRISKKKIRVMVRPQNSFITNDQEVDQMVTYIKAVKQLNYTSLEGFVCGYKKGDILDLKTMQKLILAAKPYKITLHKVADEIPIDCKQITNLGIDLVLTQGGVQPILNNITYLKELNQDINVLVGGGVTEDIYKVLKKHNLNIHIGRLARINTSYNYPIDINKIALLSNYPK